jgi:peptide/nickel transport system substrate-binding protein
MSKRLAILIALALVLALVSCTPREGEVIEVTRVITETVELEGEPVEVTRVVTEEVEVTRVVEEVVAEEVAAEPQDGATYIRSETLYTTGSAWSPPSDWNPITNWFYSTGTIGLVYEPMFLYDPAADEMIPWLAESGEWVDANTYAVKIRERVEWTDGQPLTAADVKFTFELGTMYAAVHYSTLWDWLENIELVDDYNLILHFTDPLYHSWARYSYTIPIVPKHIWENKTEEEVTAGLNENPVGSGAYVYETHSQDRQVWLRNENWWATELLGLTPGPKRIVDLVNRSNNVSLGMLLQGDIDISNNFLPGVKELVRNGYIETYYPEEPYMLPANSAVLFMNLQKAPMDDVAFRKALAFAVNVDEIVNIVYGGIVQPANAVGLLPVEGWSKYLDEELIEQYGFSYDPEQARVLLEEAGYIDTNNDGFVEAPDGSEIALKVIVPFGWTDWMESVNVIARSAQAVGINVEPEFPDFGGYQDQLYGGSFDMAINNFGSGLSNSPWTYYYWYFRYPIREQMNNGNFGRYDNQVVFDLVEQLDKTMPSDTEAMQEVMSALQEATLVDLPAIPLWYNGLWYQANTSVWGNFPSILEGRPAFFPCTWGGYWELGGLLTLTELQPQETE